jgi:membrane-bound lytic murein transglycosylase F
MRGFVAREKKNEELMVLLLLLLFLAIVFYVGSGLRRDALEAITERKEITVLTVNNAHCYYIYRDRPMGFEYDLAKAFSSYLGVRLKVVTTSWDELYTKLTSGEGDFIAANLSFSKRPGPMVGLSDPYLVVKHQVVIHKDNSEIRKLEDLRGRSVHVRRGSAYEDTLEELKRNKGWDIRIRRYEDMPTEELIKMVGDKQIGITVSDSHIAMLNRRYYPDTRIAFSIGRPQSLSWAVRKGEKALLDKIDEFLRKIKQDGTFESIYEKYYGNVEDFDYVDLKKYHERLEERLPKYRPLIEKAAQKYGFDWRLISAMVYQESHFDPEATSFTGVEGIMQLTQETAADMGLRNRKSVEKSIMAGARYLRQLYNKFDGAGSPDRLYFALASYNVGRGHVTDAQKIAAEKGLDPNSWAVLEEVLPLLSYRKYYKKTAYGYCRGTEPVNYVNRIRTYYDILVRGAIG